MTTSLNFRRISADSQKKLYQFCYSLFGDMNIDKFLSKAHDVLKRAKENASENDYYMSCNYYFSSGKDAIFDFLSNDREVMSKFNDLRSDEREGLMEERYILALLDEFANAIVMIAAHHDRDCNEFLRTESKSKFTGQPPYYLKQNPIVSCFLGKNDPETKRFKEEKIEITKEMLLELAKDLAPIHKHKNGWLENKFKEK